MEELKLIEATEKDISVVAELASVIWNQHYPSIIGQEQVNYMLNVMYSPQRLAEQLKEKSQLFYLISLKNRDVGFISVNEEDKGNWFLNKFYINQDVAAKGVGSEIFKILINKIKPQSITLTVNRRNYKSINFYFKNGFKIKAIKDIDIGNGFLMNDFMMVWNKK